MTEIVSDDGLMRACNSCKKGGVFYGGSARMVQDALGISGDHFLYVGDHIYTDAALAKLNFKCVAVNDDACAETQQLLIITVPCEWCASHTTLRGSSHMCAVHSMVHSNTQ
jgi:5' nucleotidase family